MSLCDRCFAPGQCCKRITLLSADDTPLSTWVGEGEAAKQMVKVGLPFEPLEHGPIFKTADDDPDDPAREFTVWSWRCPRLQPDGRCGDYENRPDLCRRFEPASNLLCVHWSGEAGDASAEWGHL